MKSGIEHTGGDEAGGLTPLVLFLLEGRRYALPLEAVEAVLRAVAVTGLPRAPEAVRGVVDYHGDLLPVMDPRVPLCHPTREVQPSDHFIVAQTSPRDSGEEQPLDDLRQAPPPGPTRRRPR